MSETLKDRTPGLWSNIKFKIGKAFEAIAQYFYGDHLIVLKDNYITRINAAYARQPFRCWYHLNNQSEAEVFRSNRRLRHGGNDVELVYDEIDQIVDPAAIKMTETLKENEELREKFEENPDDVEGIQVMSEKSYIDPQYLQNTNPYGIDSNTFRQVYSDAEESVKNMIPDDDSTLKEVGKAVTYVFLGFLITFIAMGQGGGGAGSAIDSVPIFLGLL